MDTSNTSAYQNSLLRQTDRSSSEASVEVLRREVAQYRAFISNSSEGIWRFELTTPISTALPEDAQIDAFYTNGYLAECNDAFARMYGFERATDIVGARLGDMLPRSLPRSENYLRTFIRSGYQLVEEESLEVDRDGHEKHFANSIIGIIENGFLRHAWGTQRDITEQRRLERVLAEREFNYSALVDNAPDVLIRYDLNKRYLYINQTITQHSGLPPEHFIGKLVGDIGAPANVTATWNAALDQVLQTGQPQTIEFTYINPYDKQLHTYETTLNPEFQSSPDSEPQIISVVALSRDVTERARAAQALRASEERYRALVDASSQIVWTTTPNGEMRDPQPGWCAYTGQTEDEIKGFGWAQAVYPEDRIDSTVWQERLRNRLPFTCEHRVRRYDGAWRIFAVRGVPLFNSAGQVREWVGVHTDITDQREADAKQQRFMREMLFSATEGRLRLCETPADLPDPLVPVSPEIELTAPTLHELRQDAGSACKETFLSSARAGDLITAVGEAAMNAVRHAGMGIGQVYADKEAGIVQVRVRDQGTGIQQDNLHRATLEAGYSSVGTLGHGFSLILACADRVWLLTGPSGTTVVMEKSRTPPAPAWAQEELTL